MKQDFLPIKKAVERFGLSDKAIRRLLREGKLTRYVPMPGTVLVSVAELNRLIRVTAGRRSTRGRNLKERREMEEKP